MHLIIVQDANNVITLTGEWLCRSTCLSHASAEQRFAKSNSRLKLIPSQCSLDFSFAFASHEHGSNNNNDNHSKNKVINACAQAVSLCFSFTLRCCCCAAPSFSLMPHSLFNRHSKCVFFVLLLMRTQKMRSKRMNNQERTGIGRVFAVVVPRGLLVFSSSRIHF